MNKDKDGNNVIVTIGGITLLFDAVHPGIKQRIQEHYKEYLSSKKPDIYIRITYRDFTLPRNKSLLFRTRSWELFSLKDKYLLHFPAKDQPSCALLDLKKNNVRVYTKDETGQLLLFLFPEILYAFILPRYNGLLLHGCAVMKKNKGYCFIARSGGGKSTVAKLALKSNITVLNDDRVIIRKTGGCFRVYGNPWHGEVDKTKNQSTVIKEIFFLKKAAINKIAPISKGKALKILFTNIFSFPLNKDIIKQVFLLATEVIGRLACYTLQFKPTVSVWRALDGHNGQISAKE
jgi:hypothetical protein